MKSWIIFIYIFITLMMITSPCIYLYSDSKNDTKYDINFYKTNDVDLRKILIFLFIILPLGFAIASAIFLDLYLGTDENTDENLNLRNSYYDKFMGITLTGVILYFSMIIFLLYINLHQKNKRKTISAFV